MVRQWKSSLAVISCALGAGLGLAQLAHAQVSSESIKSEIMEIALENFDRRDNLAETRKQLEPLVNQLIEVSNYQAAPAVEELAITSGAWKEIFSDDIEPDPPGFTTDRDGVYQIVTPDGYFYNLGELRGPFGVRAVGILRGEYEDAGEFLNIEFTDVSVRLGRIDRVGNLVDFIEGIESGSIRTLPTPGDNRVPNGPVGARGEIKNLYIDDTMRIATGQNFADGTMDLYVLIRVDQPTRVRR